MGSTELRAAAQQALEFIRWSQFVPCQSEPFPKPPLTAPQVEAALRAALAEPVQQGCNHCNQPLYAAIKCRVCGRVTEPVQEPVAWRFKATIGMPWSLSDDGYYISCKRDQRYFVEALYTAPPQRKPLTEEEIDGLMQSIGLRCADDGNERMANHAEWERRQRRRIARAIERAHGIGGNDE